MNKFQFERDIVVQITTEAEKHDIRLKFPICYGEKTEFSRDKKDNFVRAIRTMYKQGSLFGFHTVIFYPTAHIVTIGPNNDPKIMIRGVLYIGHKYEATASLLKYEKEVCSGVSVYKFPKNSDGKNWEIKPNADVMSAMMANGIVDESTEFDESYNNQNPYALNAIGDKNCFAAVYRNASSGGYDRYLVVSSFHRKTSLDFHDQLVNSLNDDPSLTLTSVLNDEKCEIGYRSVLKKKSSENRDVIAHQILTKGFKIEMNNHDITAHDGTIIRGVNPSSEVTWNTISELENDIYYYSSCYNLHDHIGNYIVMGIPNETPNLLLLYIKSGTPGSMSNNFCYPMSHTSVLETISDTLDDDCEHGKIFFKMQKFNGDLGELAATIWNNNSFKTEIRIFDSRCFDDLTGKNAKMEVIYFDRSAGPLGAIISSPNLSKVSAQKLFDTQRESSKYIYMPLDHDFVTNIYLPSLSTLVKKQTILKGQKIEEKMRYLFSMSNVLQGFIQIPKEVIPLYLPILTDKHFIGFEEEKTTKDSNKDDYYY